MNYPDALSWGLGCAMLTCCAGTGLVFIFCQCAQILFRVLDSTVSIFVKKAEAKPNEDPRG